MAAGRRTDAAGWLLRTLFAGAYFAGTAAYCDRAAIGRETKVSASDVAAAGTAGCAASRETAFSVLLAVPDGSGTQDCFGFTGARRLLDGID